MALAACISLGLEPRGINLFGNGCGKPQPLLISLTFPLIMKIISSNAIHVNASHLIRSYKCQSLNYEKRKFQISWSHPYWLDYRL
jgi:hypothetical protein